MLRTSSGSRSAWLRTLSFLSVLLLAVVAACSDDGPLPPTPVASVEISPDTLTLQLEATRQLSATTKAADGRPLSNRQVAWTSRDTDVVTVSASGVIQGLRGGSTTITAESEGRTGTATVTVANPLPSVSSLAPATAPAGSGASPLTVSGQGFAPGARVLWNGTALPTTRVSATELRAEVGAAALENEGTAQVTVDNPVPGGGTSSALSFTISPMPVALVTVSPPTLSLGVGEQATLEATPKGADGRILTGRVITWTSSDPLTAEVNANGRVTAHRPGPVVILAVSEGQGGTAEITVRPVPVASITLSHGALDLEQGRSQQLTATLRDASGQVITGRSIQWTSSAPHLASVTSTGVVTALDPGTALITAESEGKTAFASVVVEAGPAADLIYNTIGFGDLREIFLLELRVPGTPPSRVDAGTTSRDPSPSPDGNRIAFVRESTDATTQRALTDIYAVDRNGANLRRLTTLSGVSDDPAWSPVPGANKIAFRHWSSETRRSDIWVMDADGANPRNLTGELPDGALRHSPAWSSDGQWIAFGDSRAAGNVQSLWIMRADGTEARQLAGGMATFISHPSWSPDGQRIVFSRFSSGDSDIAILDLNRGDIMHFPMPGHQRAPAWSPDGRHIAFSHQVVGAMRLDIYTMRADGTDLRLRTSNSAWGGGDNPAWIRRPQD